MNPRMYITGQGTPEDFQIIEDFLSEMDIEVVNPYKVGIEMDAPWQIRFLDELKVFEGCEMLFLMDKWDECPACIHIKLEAERTQKDIWRESVMNREKRGMEAVKHAIFDVLGVPFGAYSSKGRDYKNHLFRMIYIKHCRKFGISLQIIGNSVHRDHSTIIHSLGLYDDEYRYNREFRKMADSVNDYMERMYYNNPKNNE